MNNDKSISSEDNIHIIEHDQCNEYDPSIYQLKIDDIIDKNNNNLNTSLGIETAGGTYTILIPKNSKIPIKKIVSFTTFTDNQTAIDIKVFQGETSEKPESLEILESLQTINCKRLSEFRLLGIPPMKSRVPEIEICYSINNKNILIIEANFKLNDKSKKLFLQSLHQGITNNEFTS